MNEDLESAKAWSGRVKCVIVPLKGGIQFEEGTDQERMARAEKNMAYQAVAACRQHPAIDQVGYGTATYRLGEGRKPGTQWFQEVMVEESVYKEIVGEGKPTQEGSPGWTNVERGAIAGSGEQWILITGTAKYDKYENGEVREEDRDFQAIVCMAEAWKDHPRFGGYIWEEENVLHVGVTAHIHSIDAGVPMHMKPHRLAVRNALLKDVMERMDPPPSPTSWGLQTDAMQRTVRLIRSPGEDTMRTVHIGANVPCRFVWRGDPEKIGEAKKLLFLPSLAEVAQEVVTAETQPGTGKFTAVVTRTALTPVFWSTQGGSPVVLPALAEKRAGASETRARWEGKERKMLAIGGWDAAKEYATGVKSAKEARDAERGAKPTQAGKPFKQVAQELEAALKSQIYVVQVEAFGDDLGSISCTGMLGRLSKALARLDPPPATDPKSLQEYIPVADGVVGEPMYIPELTAQSACYGPKGTQTACESGVCWSVRLSKERGRRLWQPAPKATQREVPGAQGLPQRQQAAKQRSVRPQLLPAPQEEQAFTYDDDDMSDDIRSASGRMGLAEVPAWMLAQRPRNKRALRDIAEEEEPMEMEEPDEVRDAVQALPTKLPRSERARDQVPGVLMERLLDDCVGDPAMHTLVECTRALIDGKEEGWGDEMQVAELVMHLYQYVPSATTRKVAKTIQAMGECGIMRREKDEQGIIVLQDRMREPWKKVSGASYSSSRVPPSIAKMTNDHQYLHAAGRGYPRTPPKNGRGRGGGKGGGRGGR